MSSSFGADQPGTVPDSGVMAAILRLLGSLTRYGQAIAALAVEESKEAGTQYAKVLVYLLVGLIFAIFGYFFVVLFLAFLFSMILGWNWIWIALVFALVHLGLFAVCLIRARENFRQPIFPMTSAEIRRDADVLQRAGRADTNETGSASNAMTPGL
jgi:uncharacterized membrane protein YqjE